MLYNLRKMPSIIKTSVLKTKHCYSKGKRCKAILGGLGKVVGFAAIIPLAITADAVILCMDIATNDSSDDDDVIRAPCMYHLFINDHPSWCNCYECKPISGDNCDCHACRKRREYKCLTCKHPIGSDSHGEALFYCKCKACTRGLVCSMRQA